MTEIVYHPKADDEVLEAARFYERRSQNLGWRFLQVVREAETRIGRRPRSFPVLEDEIRRCILRGFPHTLLFRIEDDDRILVIAVAHQSRRPGYWRRRVRGGA